MQTHYDAYGRERAWSRQEKRDASLERWQALHPGERVPSIVEAAERGQIEAEAEQAAMDRGECCGRCSASGLCGSSRWGWLFIHRGSGRCPQFDFERGIQNWLKAILGDEYVEYCGDGRQEKNGHDGGDNRGQAKAPRGEM